MDPDSTSRLVLFVICLIFSGFFSAAETSITTINKVRLRNHVENGTKGAKNVSKLLEKPEKTLTTILIGNNFVNIAASSLSTVLVMGMFSDANMGFVTGIATGVVTFVILIFGEITPKTFAVRYNEPIAFFVSAPIRFLSFIMTPIVFVLNKITGLFLFVTGAHKRPAAGMITEEEIITMVNMSHEQGAIEPEERHMISNVFDFGDGMLREIMTPRVNVIMVDMESSYAQVLAVFREHQFTRMPVYRESADEIVGIINLKDLLLEEAVGEGLRIESVLRPANFVYEFNNISKTFAQMRREHVGLSVVLDEYGIMSGIITMEDFIEEIVGEITDEYDEDEAELIYLEGEDYVVDGTLAIDTFNETTGSNVESDEFESIGGFLLGLAAELPEEGTTLPHENMIFTVEKVENNRIERIRVHFEQPAQESGEEESFKASDKKERTVRTA